MSNIVKMNVNEMIDLETEIIEKSCKLGMFNIIPSVMLWGPPGIGKSQGIFSLARNLEEKLNKKVIVHDVRLINFNPVDLRGIPTSDVNKKVAIWLKPQIFQMDDSEDIINILFLDEISACVPSVQAAAYQITLDKKVGEHELPSNCIVFAAGNRITDKAVSYKMSSALANRLTHIEIGCDLDDWKIWALNNNIDGRIISYINYKNSSLFQFNPNSDDLAFATPRSWERADFYLKVLGNIDKAYKSIAGTVGLGIATDFKTYNKVYDKLPNIKKILEGEDVKVPKEPDILYATSGAIVQEAIKIDKKNDDKELNNILKYITKMSVEFAILTTKDLLKVKGMTKRIEKLESFNEWAEKFGKYIS